MDLKEQEKDDFYMMVVIMWPIWVLVICSLSYLFYLSA